MRLIFRSIPGHYGGFTMRQHTMRGVAYRADRTVEVIDYPMPTLESGQVLIRE